MYLMHQDQQCGVQFLFTSPSSLGGGRAMAYVFSAFLEEQLTELHMRIVEKHEELPQLSLSTHPDYISILDVLYSHQKNPHTHTHTLTRNILCAV